MTDKLQLWRYRADLRKLDTFDLETSRSLWERPSTFALRKRKDFTEWAQLSPTLNYNRIIWPEKGEFREERLWHRAVAQPCWGSPCHVRSEISPKHCHSDRCNWGCPCTLCIQNHRAWLGMNAARQEGEVEERFCMKGRKAPMPWKSRPTS